MPSSSEPAVAVHRSHLDEWVWLLHDGIRMQGEFASCASFFGAGDQEETPAFELLGGITDYLDEVA